MDIDSDQQMERNIEMVKGLIPPELSNRIPMPPIWAEVDKWELMMNILAQKGNDMQLWMRFKSDLISKSIESKRIKEEIDTRFKEISKRFVEKFKTESNTNLPDSIEIMIKTEVYEYLSNTAEPKIYEYYCGSKNESDEDYGSPLTPDEESPWVMTGYKGWKRGFWEKDKREAIIKQLEGGTNVWINNDNPWDEDFKK